MKCIRIVPEMWASNLCPFSSSTRKVAFGSDSTTVPSTWMPSSFATRCALDPYASGTDRISGPFEPTAKNYLEEIKATDAAAENYGNFYGQNLSPVQPGILLVYGTLRGLGYEVSLWRMIFFTTPIVLSSVILGAVQFLLLDRRKRERRKT